MANGISGIPVMPTAVNTLHMKPHTTCDRGQEMFQVLCTTTIWLGTFIHGLYHHDPGRSFVTCDFQMYCHSACLHVCIPDMLN